ncbi:YtzI protein [Bacillaceae bacterium W0354]
MLKVLLISVVISLIVLILSVATISKAYAYQHKVDPLPDNKEQSNKD